MFSKKETLFKQKLFLSLGLLGVLILFFSVFDLYFINTRITLSLSLGLIVLGVMMYTSLIYDNKLKSINNNDIWFNAVSSRGLWSWIICVLLTLFYVLLYFYPSVLGLGKGNSSNSGFIALFDPLSILFSGNPASEWFVYGTLYTIAILVFGYKFILKYRGNRYQQFRTISVLFFQLGFAYLIPEFMARLNHKPAYNLPYYDLKSMWPLNYYLFDDWSLDGFLSSGNLGLIMLLFGVLSIFVISPILTYKYGKRWYCSWVCGCGALAETAGDPFRQLSSKKLVAWKIERWLIYFVLVFSVIMTIAVIDSYLVSNTGNFALNRSVFLIGTFVLLTLIFAGVMIFKRHLFPKNVWYGGTSYFVVISLLVFMYFSDLTTHLFFIEPTALRSAYGFYIGALFSGVIGTGFYPILGNRVWCRFGCPMAAILGFQQRLFSKFRITTNGGQCISCGNCSTYCEMGIDVRAYAQRGENIVRSSCVGCGICSAVCPRGVLNLENGSPNNRINPMDEVIRDNIDLLSLTSKER